MLITYVTPEDFLSSDQKDFEKYVSKRISERIRRIARDSPGNSYLDKALKMEISSLIRMLKVLMDEEENFEKAMKSDPEFENHVIMNIPRIIYYNAKGYFGVEGRGIDATMDKSLISYILPMKSIRRNMIITRKRSMAERPYSVIKIIFHGGHFFASTIPRG